MRKPTSRDRFGLKTLLAPHCDLIKDRIDLSALDIFIADGSFFALMLKVTLVSLGRQPPAPAFTRPPVGGVAGSTDRTCRSEYSFRLELQR